MTVPVQFPDGTVRNVPGQLKIIRLSYDEDIGAYEQVPINCDPHWFYERQDQQWLARRRTQRLTALRPPVEEWWRSIRQMAEEAPSALEQNDLTAATQLGSNDVRSAA